MATTPLYLLDPKDPSARACQRCSMRGVALFGVLDEPHWPMCTATSRTSNCSAGEALFQVGQEGEAVYTLARRLCALRARHGGWRAAHHPSGRQRRTAGLELLLQRPHQDDAIACTPATLCRIPVNLVLRLGALHPSLLRELMERWQQALEDSQAWLADLTSGTARRRVLKLLAKMAQHAAPGQPVWVPRREEMGDMLNLTIETTSRQVSRLRREGVLRTVNRRHAHAGRRRRCSAHWHRKTPADAFVQPQACRGHGGYV
jgi:CRP/FNR family transcriptional regulator